MPLLSNKCTLQDLIRRARALVQPNKHPKTAAALDELQIAVTWADQIARCPFVFGLSQFSISSN